MTLHYKRFIPFSPEKERKEGQEGKEEAIENQTSPLAKAAKVAKAGAYEKLARSDLVRRYAAALEWILENRNELHEIVRAADQGPEQTDVFALEAAMRAAVQAFESAPPASESARVFLPSINREVWIASDSAEAARLGQELGAEGDELPVILAEDMVRLRGQNRQLIDATVRALAILGGRLTSVGVAPDETLSGVGAPQRLASHERLDDLDVVDGTARRGPDLTVSGEFMAAPSRRTGDKP
jgi:hypothetical protein